MSFAESGAVLRRPTFHALIRRVRLETLRQHFPDTKEQLHHALADYFRQQVEAEQAEETAGVTGLPKKGETKGTFADGSSKWLTEIPEQEFNARVEYLYHALQVRALQGQGFQGVDSFDWRSNNSSGDVGKRDQSSNVVAQLTEEGEPFFSRTSSAYGNYLLYSFPLYRTRSPFGGSKGDVGDSGQGA